jgi:hypothetical protein
MKRLLITLTPILLFLQNNSFGQNDKTDSLNCKSYFDSLVNRAVFINVDTPPKPEGGEEKLFKKLNKEITLKPFSKNEPIGSKTIISFVVAEQGKIIGKRIERDDFKNSNIPEQMFKVIESIYWEPGKCNDKVVPVQFKLPLNICLK